MSVSFLRQFRHPTLGVLLTGRWEHFGDPNGPGDLFLNYEMEDVSEVIRPELHDFMRRVEGNYETRRAMYRALQKARKV